MENGVGMADGSVMVDDKIVEESVVNAKVEERVVGGSNEMKDVEDEVFEEAIGTLERLQEQTESSELGDGSGVADAIGNGEAMGDSGSEQVQEKSNYEPEAETFEEAIGVPSEVGPQEDAVPSDVGPQVDLVPIEVGPQEDDVPSEVGPQEDVGVSVDELKVEELLGGESGGGGGGVVSDKIDERGNEMGAGTDELNDGKEVPEISGTGKTEVLRDKDEGNVKSDKVIEKPVHGDADKLYLDGSFADKKLETLEVDKVEGDVKMEPNLEVLPQESKGEESREDALATGYQDKKVSESADTSAGIIFKVRDDEVEASNDKSTNFDTGDQGKERTEVERAIERAIDDLDSLDGGDEGGKAHKALATVEVEDNRNGEVKIHQIQGT